MFSFNCNFLRIACDAVSLLYGPSLKSVRQRIHMMDKTTSLLGLHVTNLQPVFLKQVC